MVEGEVPAEETRLKSSSLYIRSPVDQVVNKDFPSKTIAISNEKSERDGSPKRCVEYGTLSFATSSRELNGAESMRFVRETFRGQEGPVQV